MGPPLNLPVPSSSCLLSNFHNAHEIYQSETKTKNHFPEMFNGAFAFNFNGVFYTRVWWLIWTWLKQVCIVLEVIIPQPQQIQFCKANDTNTSPKSWHFYLKKTPSKSAQNTSSSIVTPLNVEYHCYARHYLTSLGAYGVRQATQLA